MSDTQRVFAAVFEASATAWAYAKGRPLNAAQWALIAAHVAPHGSSAETIRRIAYLGRQSYAAESVSL